MTIKRRFSAPPRPQHFTILAQQQQASDIKPTHQRHRSNPDEIFMGQEYDHAIKETLGELINSIDTKAKRINAVREHYQDLQVAKADNNETAINLEKKALKRLRFFMQNEKNSQNRIIKDIKQLTRDYSNEQIARLLDEKLRELPYEKSERYKDNILDLIITPPENTQTPPQSPVRRSVSAPENFTSP